MKVFKDIVTGDEMFTDSNKINLIDDCLYEVLCSRITRREGGFVLDGANPSAEGEDGDDCGTDEVVESGLDLVLNQHLNPTVAFNKADYLKYLKTYSQSLEAEWKKREFTEEQIKEHKAGIGKAAKICAVKIKDLECYLGESNNADGMVALLEYRSQPDGSEQAYMLFFKHALEEEKV